MELCLIFDLSSARRRGLRGRVGAVKPGKIGAMVSALGAKIVRGQIAPGSTLPSENELEALYGAGRSVVREAIKTLAAKGLVSVRPRHGTQVRAVTDWSLLDREVLGWMRSENGLNHQLLLALEETRAIIEPEAAALAALRANELDRLRIAEALDAMVAGQNDPGTAIVADLSFHLAILDATHNVVLCSFRGAVEAILRAVFDFTVGAFPDNLPNHAAVADAILAGKPDDARVAMHRVLGLTRRYLFSDHGPLSTAAGGFSERRTVRSELPNELRTSLGRTP